MAYGHAKPTATMHWCQIQSMYACKHAHTHTHIQSREALKKTKRSYGTFENKYQASILSMNIYAAFVNMTMALPLSYACFIITMPIHFS